MDVAQKGVTATFQLSILEYVAKKVIDFGEDDKKLVGRHSPTIPYAKKRFII